VVVGVLLYQSIALISIFPASFFLTRFTSSYRGQRGIDRAQEAIVRAASALGRPRKVEPALLQFVANDVNWLSPVDHK